jgi:hypothetical protein
LLSADELCESHEHQLGSSDEQITIPRNAVNVGEGRRFIFLLKSIAAKNLAGDLWLTFFSTRCGHSSMNFSAPRGGEFQTSNSKFQIRERRDVYLSNLKLETCPKEPFGGTLNF